MLFHSYAFRRNYALATVLICLANAAAAQWSQPELFYRRPGPVEQNEVLADFDQDGTIDVFFVASKFIQYHPGYADSYQHSFDITGNMSSVNAAFDFNSDGRPEIIYYDVSGIAHILWNDVEQTFPETIPAGQTMNSFDAADYNLDGIPDWSVGNTIYLNSGDGMNATSVTASLNIGNLNEAFDINNDNLVDLVTYSNDQVRVRFNQGNFVFGAQTTYLSATTSATGYKPLMYDDDDDGDLDYFYFGGALLRRENNGNGTFAAQTNALDVAGEVYLAAGDYDQNGQLDVLIQTAPAGTIRMHWNAVWGSTSAGQDLVNYSQLYDNGSFGIDSNKFMTFIAESDFMLMGRIQMDGVYYWFEVQMPDADGTLQQPLLFANSVGYSGSYFSKQQLLDMNGDGRTDIVAYQNARLRVYWQQANGEVTGPVYMLNLPQLSGRFINHIGYYNNDNLPDIFVKNNADIDVYINNGNGGVLEEPIVFTPPGLSSFQLTDFNDDQRSDLLVVTAAGPYNVYENTDSVFTNIGSQNSSAFQTLSEIQLNACADFDNNGWKDYVMLSGKILYQSENGIFYLGPQFSAADDYAALFTGDFNVDGNMDFVYEGIPNNILCYNNGDGTFTQGPAFSQNLLNASDLDLDGDPDLYYTSDAGTTQTVYALMNEASESFTETFLFTTQLGPLSMADWNNDGADDFIKMYSGQGANSINPAGYFFIGNQAVSNLTIAGSVFDDANSNGVRDEGENGIAWIPVQASGNSTSLVYTDMMGNYIININQPGIYTLSVSNPAEWTNTTPLQLEVTVDFANPNQTGADFGRTLSNLERELVFSMNTSQPLCNQTQVNWLSCYNSGTTTLSGIATLDLPLGAIAYDFFPQPDTVFSDTIQWHIENFAPGSYTNFYVSVLHPGVEYIDSLMIFESHVSFTDQLGDTLLADSIAYDLLCAYDPNMKEEHTGYGPQGFVNEMAELDYTIHFQNTGTATATDVLIVDSLSVYLDHASIFPIASSHNMQVSYTDDGALHFYFANIMLPDSGADYAASQGFIRFRIHINELAAPGTEIFNHAEIYFDQNPAIITNDVINTIFDCYTLPIVYDDVICPNVSVVFSTARSDMESYTWFVDGSRLDNQESAVDIAMDAAQHVVTLIGSHPLCEITTTALVQPISATAFTVEQEDVTYCEAPVLLQAEGNGDISWYSGDAIVNQGNDWLAESPGIYVAVLTGLCGSVQDTVQVLNAIPPAFTLLPVDGNSCNEPIELQAASPYPIEWYVNETFLTAGENLLVDATGLYTARIDDGCLSNEVQVQVEIRELPELSAIFLADSSFCFGDSVLFYLTDTTFRTIWTLNGAAIAQPTDALIVNESAQLTISVSDGYCSNTETIIFTEFAPTTVEINWNQPLDQLEATPGFVNYAWTLENTPTPFQTGSSNTVSMPEAGYYQLTATDANGCMSNADIMLISVPQTESERWQLYPQPAHEQLIAHRTPAQENIAYSILDASGRNIQRGLWPSQQLIINTSEFSEGVYYLISGEGTAQRFVVMH